MIVRSLAAALFCVASAGCGGNESVAPASANELWTADEIPSEQAVYFEDGAVNVTEYRQAFLAFSGCAEAQQFAVTRLDDDPVSGLITYGVQPPPGIVGTPLGTPREPREDNPVGACYHSTFDFVEMVFQLTDPLVLASADMEAGELYAEKIVPCLAEAGIETPSQLPPVNSAAYGQALDAFSELVRAGQC